MKKLGILILLFMLTGCNSNKMMLEKTYTSDNQKFQLSVPENWNQGNLDTEDSLCVEDLDNYLDIAIKAQDQRHDHEIQVCVDTIMQNVLDDEYKVLQKVRQGMIGDLPIYYFEMIQETEESPPSVLYVVIIEGKHTRYEVISTSENEDVTKSRDILYTILQSFKEL